MDHNLKYNDETIFNHFSIYNELVRNDESDQEEIKNEDLNTKHILRIEEKEENKEYKSESSEEITVTPFNNIHLAGDDQK